MADEIVIVGAARTPVTNFNGAFSSVPAHDLGSIAIKALLERAKLDPKQVSEVIIGQILVAGQGQNPARQASINAGIPVEAPAWSINQLDGSGLRSVVLGAQQLIEGNADVVLAGGQELMTLAPHFAYLRSGVKMGHLELTDSMLYDGLQDIFHKYHMGMTAENVAEKYQITKQMQDEFAAASQNKAEAAQKSGRFKDEIVPVTIKDRKGDKVIDTDEFPRHGVTVDQLAKIRPAFKKDGTVTAGNASGINDGAAMVALMRRSDAEKGGHPILARIVAWAHAGVDPAVMGTGPIPATHAVLKKAGWKVQDRAFGRGATVYDPWHYVPVLARKPGALRNGAPFKAWVLPAAMERVRRKLAGTDDGDRQMVEHPGRGACRRLSAVEAACAEALAHGVHSADVKRSRWLTSCTTA